MFCAITTIYLILILFCFRWYIIKPSILVIIFFHIQIQYAATIYSGYIETYLKEPVEFLILVHGFPLLGLFFSSFIAVNTTKKVWIRIVNNNMKIDYRIVFILFSITVMILFMYLSYVPFNQTGLYYIFTDASSSALAREMSLKLLDNQLIRYAYSLLMSTFSPLLAVLIFLAIISKYNKKNIITTSILILIFIYCIFSVSLTGARSPVAEVILACLFAWFIRKKAPLNPFYISIGGLLVLFVPITLTIFRTGKSFSVDLFFQYMFGGIFDRLFIVPMKTGLWHVHFAQNFSFFGVAGIPKLARMFDIEPINVPNIIGLHYTNTTIESISANTSFVFSYYSYFGLPSLLFSILLLLLLDIAIIVYSKLSDKLLVPCVATVSMASWSFINSDYSTVLLTHGFLVLLIVCYVLDRISVVRLSISVKRSSKNILRV